MHKYAVRKDVAVRTSNHILNRDIWRKKILRAAPAAAVARVPGRLACPALEPKALAAYITYLPRKTKAGPTLCAGCMSVTPNVSVCVITENPNCGIPVVRTTLSCLSNSDRLEFHRHWILFKIHYMHDFTAASAPLERALGNRTVHHVIDLAPGGKVICIPPCILP